MKEVEKSGCENLGETKIQSRSWRNKLFATKKNRKEKNCRSDDTESPTIDHFPSPQFSGESNLASVNSSDCSEKKDTKCDLYETISPDRTRSLPCVGSQLHDYDPIPLMHTISWSYELEPDPNQNSMSSQTKSDDKRKGKKKEKPSIKRRFKDPSTWLKAINRASENEKITMFGLSVAVAGTLIIHPLFFLGGVVWAVGVLSTDSSYSFFSNSSFSNLFWTEPGEKDNKSSPEALLRKVIEPSYMEQIEVIRHETDDILNEENGIEANEKPQSENVKQDDNLTTPPKDILEKKQQILERYILSEEHFPRLQHHIISDRIFDGLKATECFELFFDDEAPFSFRQFQEKMGDINIDYRKWNDQTDSPQQSFHPDSTKGCKHITKQLSRVTTFQTLTKSYFGPAYAEAEKIQVASFFSENMVIMENKTILSGIPFGDKFFVLERWVLETKDEKTSTLNASVQVCMLTSSCPFESQIRKKSVQGCTEMVKLWTRSATEALELTKQNAQHEEKNAEEMDEPEESNQQCSEPSTDELVHKHLTNFRELDKMIDSAKENGTLEQIQVFGDRCLVNNVVHTEDGIEVLHLFSSLYEQEDNLGKNDVNQQKDALSITSIQKEGSQGLPKVSNKKSAKLVIQNKLKKLNRRGPPFKKSFNT